MRRAALLLAAALAATGCATTYDDSIAPPGSVVAATTTTVPTGTVAELLPRLIQEARSLSADITLDGDKKARLAEIEGLWTALRPGLSATRPELVSVFEENIETITKAVALTRPADADKATRNLEALASSL